MEFSREELKAILSLGGVIGFIVAFKDLLFIQGGHLIMTTDGVAMLILCVFAMMISVFIHEAGHKFFANAIGYKTNTEAYYPGHVLGVVVAILSFGYIPFFTPNSADLEANPIARIHKHRKYENFKQQAFIAASGIFVTAGLAILLHGGYVLTGSKLLYNILRGNVWLMVYSLVPFELFSLYLLRIQQKIDQVPESDGLYLFHYSIIAAAAAIAFVVTLMFILLFTTSVPLWIALLVGLIIGSMVWVKFFVEGN